MSENGQIFPIKPEARIRHVHLDGQRGGGVRVHSAGSHEAQVDESKSGGEHQRFAEHGAGLVQHGTRSRGRPPGVMGLSATHRLD